MNIILKYFKDLDKVQTDRFAKLDKIYRDWNSRINVISRKDIDQLYLHHVLHSLAIACIVRFKKGTKVLDAGTGGGFPGIPLAIFFPEVDFVLADSIAKKIRVVNEVIKELELSNCRTLVSRVEKINGKFDFAVSRAVTDLPEFLSWSAGKISNKGFNELKNGILYLKGGDIDAELKKVKHNCNVFNISAYFQEEFFELKKIVHIELA
ncbi:MAG: 16S rRNA (guanine(527)-N(7))-methyltransferase RsmG [Bacteroidales bacterium]|nr:16S rRNA (guanine(527)-N(7))-methyltransferase RsmG [Bacteroidales bacterium]